MQALKKRLLSAALFGAMGIGASAYGATVDLFQTPANFTDHKVVDTTVGPGGCGAGAALPAFGTQGCFQEFGPDVLTILGGYRDIYVEAMGATSGAPTSTMYAGGGLLDFSNSGATNGYGSVQWDGADNSPTLDIDGLNANLINQTGCPVGGCDRFIANVLIADQGFQYKLTVYDLDGDWSTLTASTQTPISSLTPEDFLFAWFNLSGPQNIDGLAFDVTNSGGIINFDRIGALMFELNTAGTIAVDLQLASVEKTGLPEPGMLALVSVALLGAGAATRRRRGLQP